MKERSGKERRDPELPAIRTHIHDGILYGVRNGFPCSGCGEILLFRKRDVVDRRRAQAAKPKPCPGCGCVHDWVDTGGQWYHARRGQWVECPGPIHKASEQSAEIRQGDKTVPAAKDLLAALDASNARRIAAEQALAIVEAENKQLRAQDLIACGLIRGAYGIMQSRGYAADWVKRAHAWFDPPRRKE